MNRARLKPALSRYFHTLILSNSELNSIPQSKCIRKKLYIKESHSHNRLQGKFLSVNDKFKVRLVWWFSRLATAESTEKKFENTQQLRYLVLKQGAVLSVAVRFSFLGLTQQLPSC